MTPDQSLLAVLAIAAVFGLYYTVRGYRNSNRRRSIDVLATDFDTWGDLMQVQDPFDALLSISYADIDANTTDGYW